MADALLTPRNLRKLRAFAADGALLAFDFDGTLAPFHADAADAGMRPESLELLRSLAHCAPVAVISGRAVPDLVPRLPGVATLAVIGNHGIEPSDFAARAAAEVAEWLPAVEAAIAPFPGAFIENKVYSLSIHPLGAEKPRTVVRRLDRAVAPFAGRIRVLHGTQVVNLIPAGAPDKGDAIRHLLQVHALDRVVYVGDEATDEDVFRVLDPAHSMGIRIGRARGTAASHHVPLQTDIDEVLAELLAGRTRPHHPHAAASSGAAEPPPHPAPHESE